MPGLQVLEQLGEGVSAALHRLLTVGVRAEDGGDADLDGHGKGLLSEKVVWSRWARIGAPRLRGRTATAGGSTDGAAQPAQVDVQPRNEQRARRFVAHVEKNHGVIVSIPGPPPGV
ncbi:hypothetical protein Stsp02_09780 [Streptomyces sp. NBRC 14336]|nr:hypothetical protein Stsp02_09780 [Streptomyces sp. NBRC 14336]